MNGGILMKLITVNHYQDHMSMVTLRRSKVKGQGQQATAVEIL